MTSEQLDEAIARFATRAEANTAASKAMPRRKHRRPYPQFVGAYDCWTVMAQPNIVQLRDGSMYDHQRKVTIRE
jgi:hypothetical protein